MAFADRINSFLNVFGRWRERDEIAKEVERVVNSDQSSVGSGKITQREFMLESGRGQRLLQGGRAGEAEQVFRALLSRLEGEAEYDTRYDQTLTLQNIGRCLKAQGRPSQATDFYRRAIVLAETLEQTKQVLGEISNLHTDLADVLADIGQYEPAKEEYLKSVAIDEKTGEERNAGATLGQLGTLAMRQGDLNEARKRYLEALSLFQRMGEDQSEAVIWHQLGRVAEEARDWDEAERCHKKSLTIQESLGDWALAATSCNQLGKVAYSTGRFDECEKWARRALEIKEKLGNPKEIAVGNHALAASLLSLERFDEAAHYIEVAIDLYEKVQDFDNTVKGYATAAQIAEKRGRMDEVRAWRRKEQESFAAFAGSGQEMKRYEGLINAIAAACQGNEDALKQVEPVLQQMENGDEVNRAFAKSARRILAGERDVQSLTEGLERIGNMMTRRILQALSAGTVDGGQQTVESGPPSTVHGQAQPQEQEGPSFEEFISQLLGAVELAAQGNKVIGKQIAPSVEEMSKDSKLPPEIRAFMRALRDILYGSRSPNLDGVPNELASLIRGMLGRL